MPDLPAPQGDAETREERERDDEMRLFGMRVIVDPNHVGPPTVFSAEDTTIEGTGA